MEIRLLKENELQWAINTAHEVYGSCVMPYVSGEEEVTQYNSYVNLENLWKEMEAGNLFLWGAFEGEVLCGVAAMQKAGHITMLYVKPMFQRRGYGSALLAQMQGYAKEILALEKVTINVIPTVSAPFFYKRGFVQYGAQSQAATYVPMIANSKEMPSLRPVRNIPWGLVTVILMGICVLVLVIALAFSIHHVVTNGVPEADAPSEEFWENELGIQSGAESTEESESDADTADEGADSDDENQVPEYLAEWNIDDPEQAVALPNNLGVAFLFPESQIYVGENLSYTIEPVNFTYSDETTIMQRDFNINYPQLVFADGRDASEINEKIRYMACYYLDLMYPEVSSDLPGGYEYGTQKYTSYVEYEITYMDDNLISISLMNHYSTGQRMLELCDVYTLNIQVQTGELYHVEDLIAHNTEFDETYYQKLCERANSLTKASQLTSEVIGKTLDGEVIDGRYYSNVSLCKDGMKLNFIYHYGDSSLFLYGWADVNYTKAELADYHTESDFWNYYQPTE